MSYLPDRTITIEYHGPFMINSTGQPGSSVTTVVSDNTLPHLDQHIQVMKQVAQAGFKPNPIPQVGIEQPSASPKTSSYFS